jgi:hypothetical protein
MMRCGSMPQKRLPGEERQVLMAKNQTRDNMDVNHFGHTDGFPEASDLKISLGEIGRPDVTDVDAGALAVTTWSAASTRWSRGNERRGSGRQTQRRLQRGPIVDEGHRVV